MEEDAAEAPAVTVLVAEDHPDIRDLFTVTLEALRNQRMAGATEYLPKPIRPSALVGKADALLGGRLVTRSP